MKRNVKFAILLFFSLVAVFYRLIPLKLPNVEFFSSLIAFTILAYGRKSVYVFVPMLVIASDLLLYLFLRTPFDLKWEIIVLIGWLLVILTQDLLKGKKLQNVISMELLGTIVFYFITNSLVFFVFNFYPKTLQGYVACMIAGLPFVRNQAIFNFIFSFVVYATVRGLGYSNELSVAIKHENT